MREAAADCACCGHDDGLSRVDGLENQRDHQACERTDNRTDDERPPGPRERDGHLDETDLIILSDWVLDRRRFTVRLPFCEDWFVHSTRCNQIFS